MKQLLAPKDWDLSSEKVHDALIDYLIAKDWGSQQDGVFIPFLQLTLGQLLELCQDNGIDYKLVPGITSEPIDYLWNKIILSMTHTNSN